MIEYASKASPVVSKMYDTLESAYVYFSSSTKRHDTLSQKLDKTDGALQLRNLSKTRWSSRPETVKEF